MTTRTGRLGIVLALALVAAAGLAGRLWLAQEAQPAVGPPINVVLIGWDGAQRNHVNELLAAGKLPTLAALRDEGALVEIEVTTGATDTKAGWTQILTGFRPEKSGVTSNGKYQPIPEGCTIWERLETAFGPDHVVTLAVIGKKGHVDADAPRKVPYERWAQQRLRQLQRQKGADAPAALPAPRAGRTVAGGGTIVEEGGKLFVAIPGKPYFNAKPHLDLWVNGLIENDKVGERALAELEKHRNDSFFAFIHFAMPDHAGHAHGENSEEYSQGIISDDEWTGRIIAKLKELGLYEKTLVYVTADHGFDEGQRTHRNAPHVFLATNDKLVSRNGDRADIAPTILKRFGLDLATLQPAVDGRPLDEAEAQ